MHLNAVFSFNRWPVLLLLAAIPLLTNCTRIDGSVELNNSSGEPYSLEGAKVEVFELNPAAVLPGQTKTPKGLGSVESDDGAITLQVVTNTIDDDALYEVEIRCTANNATDACSVESPLHIVLSGAQLVAGDWKATALTEVVFQNIAYYVAAQYSPAEINRMLDNHADALLVAEPPAATETYDDVLAWSPALIEKIKRPGLINNISESLAGGINNNDIKLLARQAVNTYVVSERFGAFPADAVFNDIVVANGYAYMVGVDVGLVVADIRNPEQPVLTGRSFAAPSSRKLTVSGNFAYVMDFRSITIIDISNPQAPFYAGSLSLPGTGSYISDVEVSGEYAFICASSGLLVFNISNPVAAVQVASLPRAHPPHKVFVSGADAFITDNDGIHMIDVSNPLAPVYLWSSLPRPSVTSPLVAISSSHVYYTTSKGFFVIDIRNRTAPKLAGQLTTNLLGTKKLVLAGTKIYLPGSGWTQVIDVSNPARPVWAGHLGTDISSTSLAVAGEFAYVAADDATLSVVDLDLVAQTLTQTASLRVGGGAHDQFTPSGNHAYLRTLNGTLSIFDLSNPDAPAFLSNFAPARPYIASVAAAGDYAFMVNTYYQAIQVVDVSNPNSPSRLPVNVPLYDGSYVTGYEGFRKMVLDKNRIFVPWGNSDGHGVPDCATPGVGTGGIFTVDISIPTAPQVAGHVCVPGEAKAFTVNGNRGYASLANRLLQVVDLSNLAQPVLAGSLQLSAVAKSVAVSGNHVWAAEGANGVEIVDVGDSTAPQSKAGVDTTGQAGGIAFKENYAYVADGSSGLLIFDASNPDTPQLVASISTRGFANSVFLIDDYLYAGTSYGIEVFKAMPASN